MAVEAPGSKYSRNNKWIVAVVCLAGALWFGYDGWVGDYSKTQLAENEGKPTANLQFNRYAPIPLVIIAIVSAISAQGVASRKIVADEKGLVFPGGELIAYASIESIDKRFFEKEGRFSVQYSEGGVSKTIRFSDRKNDNLGLLLDEVVRRTGAAPAEGSEGKE